MAEVNQIGMLTGGGDAPGLNGVIRAVTIKSINDYGYEVAGIKRGWKGLLAPETDSIRKLSVADVYYILEAFGSLAAQRLSTTTFRPPTPPSGTTRPYL